MSKTIEISEEEYDILTRIAFLISDAKLAEYDDDFADQMEVDPCEYRCEADALVAKWERME